MSKLLFMPFGLAFGLAAGFLSKKVFDKAWALIDDTEPPEPEEREINWPKLIAALALQGAVFRVAKGLGDHMARAAFERWAGSWPGDERPEPSESGLSLT